MDTLFKLFEQHPVIPLGLLIVVVLALVKRNPKKSDKPKGFLDQVLFHWTPPLNPFFIVDLVRSVAFFGAAGAGKTSGGGYRLAKAIVRNLETCLCILASKPEDREFWKRIFAKASKPLLIFGPDSPLRFNFLDFMLKHGAEARDIAEAIMVIGERLEQGTGHNHELFWRQQKQRTLETAVEIVLRGTRTVAAPLLQKFINSAAQKPEDVNSEEWKKGFQSQCFRAAYQRLQNDVHRHNFQQAFDMWHVEWPSMSDKTRSGIVADVMGTLHVFNTGIVRELLSTTTNVSPAMFDEGKSILVDMPISRDGVAGACVLGTWKWATQWYILKRKVNEDTPVCVLWADEYQKVTNSGDPRYLAECRSHRGCMVVLTQSIHALYTCMHEGGEHETDSLLTNFHHKVFHALGDAKSAEFASALVGRRLTTRHGGSSSPADNVYDELFGQSRFSSNFSTQMENILEPREFMHGMRTGGKDNGYMVDGIVVRSAQPFSTGESYLKVAFSQK